MFFSSIFRTFYVFYVFFNFCPNVYYIYTVIQISDELRRAQSCREYVSLQYALFSTCVVCVAGGAVFLVAAVYVHRDRRHTEQIIAGKPQTSLCRLAVDVF